MDWLGSVLGAVIIFVWLWPKAFGGWLRQVHEGFHADQAQGEAKE